MSSDAPPQTAAPPTPLEARILDAHVHIVGDGSSGSGCWLRPSPWRRLFAAFMARQVGLPPGALRGGLDRLYVERLLQLVRESSLDAVVERAAVRLKGSRWSPGHPAKPSRSARGARPVAGGVR